MYRNQGAAPKFFPIVCTLPMKVTVFSNRKKRYINEFTYLLFQNENNERMDNNVRFNKWSRFKFNLFNVI